MHSWLHFKILRWLSKNISEGGTILLGQDSLMCGQDHYHYFVLYRMHSCNFERLEIYEFSYCTPAWNCDFLFLSLAYSKSCQIEFATLHWVPWINGNDSWRDVNMARSFIYLWTLQTLVFIVFTPYLWNSFLSLVF